MNRKDKLIAAKVSFRCWKLLKKVCDYRNEDLSDFIRRAVLKELASLSYLPEEQKKALGMITGGIRNSTNSTEVDSDLRQKKSPEDLEGE